MLSIRPSVKWQPSLLKCGRVPKRSGSLLFLTTEAQQEKLGVWISDWPGNAFDAARVSLGFLLQSAAAATVEFRKCDLQEVCPAAQRTKKEGRSVDGT
jgi:hypothetical protein